MEKITVETKEPIEAARASKTEPAKTDTPMVGAMREVLRELLIEHRETIVLLMQQNTSSAVADQDIGAAKKLIEDYRNIRVSLALPADNNGPVIK